MYYLPLYAQFRHDLYIIIIIIIIKAFQKVLAVNSLSQTNASSSRKVGKAPHVGK